MNQGHETCQIFTQISMLYNEDKLVLQVIGPKGVMLLICAPDIRVGRECLLNLHRIYLL
jgi:hypothetical protein